MLQNAVLAALLLSGAAIAADPAPKDRSVRALILQDAGAKPIHTGDTVPFDLVHELLFLDEPCPLDIEGRESMRRFWWRAGAYQLGCWYAMVDEQYTRINGLGRSFPSMGLYWAAVPRAILHPDNSVTITEPDYNSDTFTGDVMSKKSLQLLEQHRNERP
jgi:hypothetical protein